MRRVLPVLLMLFGGCTNQSVAVAVHLVTAACPGAEPPTAGVNDLRFTVSSVLVYDGGTTSSGSTAVYSIDGGTSVQYTEFGGAGGQLLLASIPLATTTIQVEGVTNQTASATVLAKGSSGPFVIPSDGSVSSMSVTVFLRGTGASAFTNSSSSPTTCTQMATPRAYHSQALLADGKVLIYGGLQYPATIDWGQALAMPPMVVATKYLNSAEIYNPTTGTFEDAGYWTDAPPPPSPRAFGQMLAFQNGGALVMGGENAETTDNSPLAVPAWNGGLYSPDTTPTWSATEARLPIAPHAHGCLGQDALGHALVLGGYSQLSAETETGNITGLTTTGAGESMDPTVWPPVPIAVALLSDGGGAGLRADQACAGFEGALGGLTNSVVVEFGGTSLDATGENASILSDWVFYQWQSNSGTTSPSAFAPKEFGAAGSGLIAGNLQYPRARAKAVPMKVTEAMETAQSDAILVTGGLTCTPQSGANSCSPFSGDAGTSGPLAGPPYAYFNSGGTDVGQTTELLHFIIGAVPGRFNVTRSSGPLLPSNRMDHCAVALPDGRAVLIGGLSGTSASDFGTIASIEVVADAPTPEAVDAGQLPQITVQPASHGLIQPRAGMACTLLADGSILVTGGIQTTGTLASNGGSQQSVTTLQSAEIFYPLPLAGQ